MEIRKARPEDMGIIAPLIAKFRVCLAAYRGTYAAEDLPGAQREVAEYIRDGYPMFYCMADGVCAGYLVCRRADDVYWAESLYVADAYRRRGIATALYERAEALIPPGDTLYNYIHPTNQGIIAFLKKRGYTVLNLIEIRKPHPGEIPAQRIRVGENLFDY